MGWRAASRRNFGGRCGLGPNQTDSHEEAKNEKSNLHLTKLAHNLRFEIFYEISSGPQTSGRME